eukprot:CAMPEP_0202976084 /NCGR_PEP_ID=MMETSP1396-20130829/74254_1 /ASSEMBLY_ACC=CAM_ASM_000872 /TAXON_ID= /ORGANISM="Pseudokeronopsis sp., Strain Brazil" /LENGTH=43 /DNA_ID= /DNA_START= /DNA_END= /DNA_ORIENTATION=
MIPLQFTVEKKSYLLVPPYTSDYFDLALKNKKFMFKVQGYKDS